MKLAIAIFLGIILIVILLGLLGLDMLAYGIAFLAFGVVIGFALRNLIRSLRKKKE